MDYGAAVEFRKLNRKSRMIDSARRICFAEHVPAVVHLIEKRRKLGPKARVGQRRAAT